MYYKINMKINMKLRISYEIAFSSLKNISRCWQVFVKFRTNNHHLPDEVLGKMEQSRKRVVNVFKSIKLMANFKFILQGHESIWGLIKIFVDWIHKMKILYILLYIFCICIHIYENTVYTTVYISLLFANWTTLLCIRNSQIFPVYIEIGCSEKMCERQIRVTTPIQNTCVYISSILWKTV